jgi:hypothetical protein
MATIESNMSKSNAPVVTPNRAGEVIAQRGFKALKSTEVVVGNIVKLAKLPAGCVPVDLKIDFDEIDSNASPTTTAAFGILNADGDALEVTAGTLTAEQLGAGGMQGAIKADLVRAAATTEDRYIAVILGGTVATAAAGTIGATLTYRARD